MSSPSIQVGPELRVSYEQADEERAAGEEVLVERARKGDTAAFDELIQRHRRACLKRARLMIHNCADAEDECQNAFWKAFQRLEQYRGEGSFGAWLHRIVENQCLMRIRDEKNVRYVYLDEPTESNIRLEVVGQEPDPESELGSSEVKVLVKREISRMPPLLRNPMLLHDLDQLPLLEVARKLGLSIPATKSRLRRARTEMRSRIEGHCGKKGAGTLTHATRYKLAAYTRAG